VLVVAAVLGVSVIVYLASPDQVPGTTRPTTGAVPEGAEPARVVSHVDGDTIRLTGPGLDGSGLLDGSGPLDGETSVRLLEIDTPEHARDGEPAECFAEEASRALREMLPAGATVWVKPDRDLLDPYGRTLLYLWTERGDFVNLELVRQGYARSVLFEPNDEYILQMREAESEARADGRGLWGSC
jgi:micrococcal nuclease